MLDPFSADSLILLAESFNPYGPYIILLSSIILLWIFGKLLSWIDISTVQSIEFEPVVDPVPVEETEKKRPATYFQQGFHILGLTASTLEELRVLINKNDSLELALFFARYQPSIKEIDEAIDSIHEQLDLMWDRMVSTEVKSSKLAGYLRSKNHKSKNLNCLNENDFRILIEHDQKDEKIINKDLIAKFGDFLFMENLIMYDHLCQSDKPIFHIPPSNELRHMFDIFVVNGVATTGTTIPLRERLNVLPLEELQKLVEKIKRNKTFNTTDDAITFLMKNQEDTVFNLEILYPSDEIFHLNKETLDIKAIEEEWTTYNVYAKLLAIHH